MPMEMDGRVPPHSDDAEKSLLGAMMLSREAVMMAVETLQGDDFYSAVNKALFEAMCALYAAGRPVDLVTMTDELNRRGMMEGIGGAAYLVTLSRSMPSAANAQAYARIVEEKSILRRLIRACGEVSSECYTEDKTVPDILDNAEKQIYNISMKRASDSLVHIKPALMTTYANIEELYINKGRVQGVPSGFVELDRLTTGFHGGELILVGARPSMGKTAFMLNIAQHAAMVGRKTVAFFSLEMPREQLANRILCSEAHVDMQQVRQGSLTDDDWQKLAEAMGPIAQSPIYFDDTASITIPEIRSRCRRMQMEHGLDLVLIDYLQLMTSPSRNESRQNEVSDLSRQLKLMALELKIPIVVGSQLSRGAAQRQDHRPMLSDLRDSGAIEQDADTVMFLHREDYYNPETEDKNIAEVIIQKQRNGPLGTVRLGWEARYTRFFNIADQQES